MQLVAVLGVPGAGKSTLAAHLAQSIKATVFSGGDALRASARAGDSAAADLIRAGLPIPSATYVTLVERWAERSQHLVGVLDGSPRDVAQAAGLAAAGLTPGCAVVIFLPRRTAEHRLRSRADRSQRFDDDDSIIARRLDVQSEALEEVIEFLTDSIPLLRIDGTRTPTDVSNLAESWVRECLSIS